VDEIRQSFARYFQAFGLELPDPLPPRGYVGGKGWSVRYAVLPDENGQPCLEFVANHRMTNSRHERILSTGEVIGFPGFEHDYSYNPSVPGDKEAAEARMKAHNDAVAEDLRSKGLI
jgi:hypothetical protein